MPQGSRPVFVSVSLPPALSLHPLIPYLPEKSSVVHGSQILFPESAVTLQQKPGGPPFHGRKAPPCRVGSDAVPCVKPEQIADTKTTISFIGPIRALSFHLPGT